MVTSNNHEEIIAECNSKCDPKGFLELYVWFLCQQLEHKDERIEWLKEQLQRV